MSNKVLKLIHWPTMFCLYDPANSGKNALVTATVVPELSIIAAIWKAFLVWSLAFAF